MHPSGVWRSGGTQASEKETKLLRKGKGEKFNCPRMGWEGEREEEKLVTLSSHTLPTCGPTRVPIRALRSHKYFVCIFAFGGFFFLDTPLWVEFLSGLYRVLTQATCIDIGIGGQRGLS